MAKDTTDSSKAVKPAKTAGPAKPSIIERFSSYVRDVRAEMTRVVWPTRQEVLNSSVVVITTLVFFIIFILITDYVIVVPLIGVISKIQIGG